MTDAVDTGPRRAGLATLFGRPNVGKSTLVNALVGEKVSIVTPKPQTTRHRIVGVVTRDDLQIGLVDTPGLHGGHGHVLNRVMNDAALGSLEGVDAVVLVVEAGRWDEGDDRALARVRATGLPAGLVVNKVDRIRRKEQLLPFIQECTARHDFAFVVPLSAERGDNLAPLVEELGKLMPAGEFLFPEDEYTDRNLRFLAAEAVREKLMMHLRQELPYAVTVEIESFEETPRGPRISAVIWVAREAHKRIVIGEGGAMLKRVGRGARLDLKHRLQAAVDLRLWVKVREDWYDDEAAVRSLGH
ncbi:GTPase Era [Salinisphaera sp. PC39]|uniref:GTPase Era n=1 Tax=Salinisphaera sp. PC39 TaxID=1304156 RepID=UPI0033408718